MLVLSRRQGEQLQIGDDVTITVLEAHRGRIRIGIEAPTTVRVMRGELQDWGRPIRAKRRDRRAVSLAR